MVVGVLEEMRIRALGVIDDAVVELSPGFTAVPGETENLKLTVLEDFAKAEEILARRR